MVDLRRNSKVELAFSSQLILDTHIPDYFRYRRSGDRLEAEYCWDVLWVSDLVLTLAAVWEGMQRRNANVEKGEERREEDGRCGMACSREAGKQGCLVKRGENHTWRSSQRPRFVVWSALSI